LDDGERFSSLKDATAYAGLAPGKRESDGKGKDLGITKKGSALLRWAMVEAAWVAVMQSARWRGVYEALKRRRQSKRAIIAVARRLLAVLASMLKSGTKYRWSVAELAYRERQSAERRQRRERSTEGVLV
jgi:transposase